MDDVIKLHRMFKVSNLLIVLFLGLCSIVFLGCLVAVYLCSMYRELDCEVQNLTTDLEMIGDRVDDADNRRK